MNFEDAAQLDNGTAELGPSWTTYDVLLGAQSGHVVSNVPKRDVPAGDLALTLANPVGDTPLR